MQLTEQPNWTQILTSYAFTKKK